MSLYCKYVTIELPPYCVFRFSVISICLFMSCCFDALNHQLQDVVVPVALIDNHPLAAMDGLIIALAITLQPTPMNPEP